MLAHQIANAFENLPRIVAHPRLTRAAVINGDIRTAVQDVKTLTDCKRDFVIGVIPVGTYRKMGNAFSTQHDGARLTKAEFAAEVRKFISLKPGKFQFRQVAIDKLRGYAGRFPMRCGGLNSRLDRMRRNSSSASSSAIQSEDASRTPRRSAPRWPLFADKRQYLMRRSLAARSRTTASALSLEQSSTTMISWTAVVWFWQLRTARATHQSIL